MWETIMAYCERYGAISLFFMLYASGFGVPVSKTLAMMAGGYLAATHRGNAALLLVACTLGIHFSDFTMFCLGRIFGPGLFKSRLFRRILPERLIPRAQSTIDQYGALSLCVVRFVPIVRTVCYALLGSLRMSAFKFNLINFPITLVYTSLFFGMGYLLGQNPDQLMIWLKRGNVGVAIFGGAMLLTLFWWVRRRSRLMAAQRMEST